MTEQVKYDVGESDIWIAQEMASGKDYSNGHKTDSRTPVDQFCADLGELMVARWMDDTHNGRYSPRHNWRHDGEFDSDLSVEVKTRQSWRYPGDEPYLFLRDNTHNKQSDIYIQTVVHGDLRNVDDPSQVSAEDVDSVEITGFIPGWEAHTVKRTARKVSENPFVPFDELHPLSSLDSFARMLSSKRSEQPA